MSYPARMQGDQIQVRVGSRWRRGVERECWQCGFPFYVPLNLRPGQGRYCTKLCATKQRMKMLIRKTVTKKCVICEDRFDVVPSKAERYKTCGKPACKTEINRRNTKARHEARRLRESAS